jgi:Raf kinase inhibitor-like YbhB/YbcL family protein
MSRVAAGVKALVPGSCVAARAGRLVRAAVAGCLLSGLLAGCGLLGGPRLLRPDAPQTMTVSSSALGHYVLSRQYTCRGAGQSPPVYWSGAPQGTKSFALIVDDSQAPITPYVYWIVFDIRPSITDVPADGLPPGARVADNSRGRPRFEPPCPRADDHEYRFTVYALNSWLKLPAGAGLKAAWQAIARHAIARGRLTASAGQADTPGRAPGIAAGGRRACGKRAAAARSASCKKGNTSS